MTIAAGQYGAISHRQAREAGLGERRIAAYVASGRWEELHPLVYRVGGSPRSWRGNLALALLAAGRGVPGRAVACRRTALHLQSPTRFERPPRLQVLVAHGGTLPLDGVDVHETRRAGENGVLAAGLWCTSGAAVLLDEARGADLDDLTQLVDDVICARLAGRTEAHDLAVAQGRGRSGAGTIRALTAPGARAVFRSRLERDGAAALDAGGVSPRLVNLVVRDQRGRIREVDVLFPVERLVVEWDGLRFHDSEAERRRDRAGDRRLVVAGYRVLRFGWREVRRRPGAVAAEVRAALSR